MAATKKATAKQRLRSHIVNDHRRQPAKSMTQAELSQWHAREHQRYRLSHYHAGENLGPDNRPPGWYTGEDAVPIEQVRLARNPVQHRPYNGWCRVEGMPLKWQDCDACRDYVRDVVKRLARVQNDGFGAVFEAAEILRGML